MTDITGKVTSVKLNIPKTSSTGKDYTAHGFEVDSNGEKTKFLVSTKMPPAKYIEKLSVGSEVTVTTGGKFNSVMKVSAPGLKVNTGSSFGGGKFSSSKPPFKDNTAGMIKGNAVSNGVALAIARKGTKVTIEDVEQAAREVLGLHAKLDNEALPKSPSVDLAAKKVEVSSDDVDF